MGLVFLSTEVQGTVAQVVKYVFWSDAYCRHRLCHKREDTEFVQKQSQVVHVDKLKVCRGKTPPSWLFIDDGPEDVAAASEDEGVDESIPGDGT